MHEHWPAIHLLAILYLPTYSSNHFLPSRANLLPLLWLFLLLLLICHVLSLFCQSCCSSDLTLLAQCWVSVSPHLKVYSLRAASKLSHNTLDERQSEIKSVTKMWNKGNAAADNSKKLPCCTWWRLTAEGFHKSSRHVIFCPKFGQMLSLSTRQSSIKQNMCCSF